MEHDLDVIKCVDWGSTEDPEALSRSPDWKLRAAIRAVNQVMAELRVRQHPVKTTIGRIARGFDFLGYRFSAAGLASARQTVERCAEDVSRRYEQGADVSRIGTYIVRWIAWVRAGLGGMRLDGVVKSLVKLCGFKTCP